MENGKELHIFLRRNPMDQEHIIEQLLDRCKLLIEGILRDPSRPSVAAASLALFEQFRAVVRLKMTLQAFWASRGLTVGANI
jgi:hypothetical protein